MAAAQGTSWTREEATAHWLSSDIFRHHQSIVKPIMDEVSRCRPPEAATPSRGNFTAWMAFVQDHRPENVDELVDKAITTRETPGGQVLAETLSKSF